MKILLGATCQAVQGAFRLSLVPVYSTTRREAIEEHLPDGRVEIRHTFSHVRYRSTGYEKKAITEAVEPRE